jgi:hypothetical protein
VRALTPHPSWSARKRILPKTFCARRIRSGRCQPRFWEQWIRKILAAPDWHIQRGLGHEFCWMRTQILPEMLGGRILRAVQGVKAVRLHARMACAVMKLTWVIKAMPFLLLLTPLVCGQNPDERLIVRLPAKHGNINQPGASPIPFPIARGQTATPGRARKCGSMAASCALPRVARVVLETEKARGRTPKPHVTNDLKNPR